MARKKKSSVIHTKRRQIEDEDGWTYVVDAPKSNKPLPKTSAFHGGDFEINGVSYINRTLEEMVAEVAHWTKAWEQSEACGQLKEMIQGMKIKKIVVLGLGSLQSSRREGRRATATQLAALQTLNTEHLPVVFQDPQYTDLDKELLSSLGHVVVPDPEAFAAINAETLVYAIHCYGPIYKKISDGTRPAILIGTDVDNFGRFDA